ncbi:hypothetical protein CEXT_348711 [Caerostris extrusa]|uniref:Uncharacterized protein n=1 Tax=Caerostris extrusa TaxID=172846 RepID=A0AAV4XP83_CAEEX|nr:hypothetical protein CEXT_348711 [Caerostris extrusa]
MALNKFNRAAAKSGYLRRDWQFLIYRVRPLASHDMSSPDLRQELLEIILAPFKDRGCDELERQNSHKTSGKGVQSRQLSLFSVFGSPIGWPLIAVDDSWVKLAKKGEWAAEKLSSLDVDNDREKDTDTFNKKLGGCACQE